MVKYKGDVDKRVTTVIPGTLDDMQHVCMRVFHMDGPIRLFKDGRFEIENERQYSRIADGDRLVVVDGEGNSADFGQLIRQFSRDQSRPIQFTATTENKSMYTPKKPEPYSGDSARDAAADHWWEKTRFAGESEMHACFTPKEIERNRQELRATPQVRPTTKFEGQTESRAAYTPKERIAEPVGEVGQGDGKWWEKTRFAGESEAKAQFTPKPVERSADTKVRAAPPPARKFEGVTEAQAAYTPKERAFDPPPDSGGRADNWWEKSKFAGESEAKAQFTPKPVERPESNARVAVAQRPKTKFEGTSESQAAYVPKRIDHSYPAQGEQVAQQPWWEKTKFSGESESASCFTPKPIEPKSDLRVAQKAVRPNMKFDGTSESRSAYTPKEAMRDAPPGGADGPQDRWWEKSKFAGESEAKAQFTPKPVERPENTKAVAVQRPQTKFEGVTESQAAYVPKHIDTTGYPSQGERGPNWWEKTTFVGESEQAAQFTRKPIEPRGDTKVDPNRMKVHRAMVHLEPSLGAVRDSQDSENVQFRAGR
jgi:hypothetical protein